MSKELAKTYDPKGIEDRLYKKWMDNGYFHAKVNPDKKPFTIVMLSGSRELTMQPSLQRLR